MTKGELRKNLINRRDMIPVENRGEYSEAICERIIGLKRYSEAGTVLIFVSTGSEVETGGIISDALGRGKTVGVPYISGSEMCFRRIESITDLVPGKFNIPTANDNCPEITDFKNCLCVVPCLSADKDGYRLGYGGGYYDRFLAKNKNLMTVAVCFDELLSSSLPREVFDIKVSMVVTERKETGV